MEKRLRSSLQTSADEFLSSATKLGFKSAKSSLKALIFNISPSSDLISSLPLSLHLSVSQSISRFKQLCESTDAEPSKSATSPPKKRLRRSSRNAKNDDDDSGATEHESKLANDKQCVIRDLQIYAYVGFLCVSHPKKAFSPSDLLPAVRELHDNLILFESDSLLLSEIASLCEEWWKEQLPGRETLISQSLPFLLSRSLTLKKKVDVHRVYVLREAFTMFDFEDESIEDLKLLLIRCVITPLYLKTDDGRKFIAFMFGLSGQLVKEVLAMIKSQIPFGRKSMLEAYADIIYRAWKVSEGVSREEIENGFLQGLIEGAIQASSASFAASIRRVLGGFVNHRTVDGVEKVLFRLAEPVIFRSLQVANSNVRQNSLHLLLDMFPLEDPDATKEVKDTLLDKQFFLLERLLMDECPDVRVVAVEGSCRILHLFWEVIPSSTITKVLTKIFDDMTYDTCSDVRLSTINGLIYLLGNPQSHEILKVLLPRLGHLIVDSIIAIRGAVLDLLLLIRDIRTFQFNKVVRLDMLLSALANDQPVIAQKITKLLIPSYFPSKTNLEEACNRCVTLLKRSPMAGARFCEFVLSEGASMQSIMELLKVIINLVLSQDKREIDQIDGLLAAAAYLCNHLVNGEVYKDSLRELLSGAKLKSLFGAAATRRARSSVCNIVSDISPNDVNSLLKDCLGMVTNCSGLSEDEERQAEVRSAHNTILSCNWFDKMFDALAKCLQKAAYGCHLKFGAEFSDYNNPAPKQRQMKHSDKISAKSNRVRGSKSSKADLPKFEEEYAIAAGIAWQIKDLLVSEDTRKALLGSKSLKIALFALKTISEVSIVQSVHCDYVDTSPVLAYTALTLHISLHNVSETGTSNNGIKKMASPDFGGTLSQPGLLDQTVDHLLNCTDKLFGAGDTSTSDKLSPKSTEDINDIADHCAQRRRESSRDSSCHNDAGSIFHLRRRITKKVNILTAVLKFVTDMTTMGLLLHNQGSCLKFTVKYVKSMYSTVKRNSCVQLQYEEEDLKEIFLCLKSSFTYAAKLLNVVLSSSEETSPPPLLAYNLANELLDLMISVESYFGSGYAARLVSAVKPWLPDLILALGSRHLPRLVSEACSPESNSGELCFPRWPLILAKIELHELNENGTSEDDDRVSEPPKFSASKKLIGMMVMLLKADTNVLDAVGVELLRALMVELERKEYEVVFGLLHFVCVKLVGDEQREWGSLNLMLACVLDIYPRIERQAEERGGDRADGIQSLENARALLEPVWMHYSHEAGVDPMTDD